jgi:hypothetical protein
MAYLIVAGVWFAVLIVFILVLAFAPNPVDGGCIDGADHEWEWDGFNDRGGYSRWKCKHCPERCNSNGAGGFGP